MTDIPNDQVDTEGKAVPPYDGRRESADVDPQEESTKDGARTAGATGPVQDDEMKGGPESERGPTASPSDEQPAAESGGSAPGAASVGPAHQPGVPRAEDRKEEEGS